MAAQTKLYRTIQGDAWDSIAYRLWNDERFASDIIAVNPAYADYLIFPAGVTLTIPDVDLSVKPASNLPPWMVR